METPGAIARAAVSLKEKAGATKAVLELGAQRPAALKEETAHPEMPQGVVGRSVRPPSPQGVPQLWRKRMGSRRSSMLDHDLRPSASAISEGRKLWS